MFLRLALFAAITSPLFVSAQQTSTVAEPEYMYQFAALKPDGSLIPLEGQKLIRHSDLHDRYFYKKGSSKETVPGEHSPVRLPGSVTLVVRWFRGADAIDPSTIVRLRPFVVEGGMRTIPISSSKSGMLGGSSRQTTADTSLPITFKKYGQDSLLITPVSPLAPGEYEIETNAGVSGVNCFGVDAGLTGYSQPSSAGAAAPATAKAEPPAWKVKPVQHPQATTDVYEATLAGSAEQGGRRGAAEVDLSCTVNRFTGPEATDASVTAGLKVRREMVAFPTESLSCEGDGADGAPFLRSQLGSEPEQTRNLCFDGELASDPKAVLLFGLGYDEPVIGRILQGSGEPLTLKVGPPADGAAALTATFQLAANGAEVLSAFDPCLKIVEAELKKEADAVVAACPEMPGKTLAKADVLVGPAMKKLASDPENDIGMAWTLPKPTRTRPVVPKLTLACSYRDGPPSAGDSAGAARPAAEPAAETLMTIPAAAKSCAFRTDGNTNVPYAKCSKE